MKILMVMAMTQSAQRHQIRKKRSPEVTVEAVHHETVEIQQVVLLKDTVYFEDE
jgi:hypothetical protein